MKLEAGQRLATASEKTIPEQPGTNLGKLHELLSQISNEIATSTHLQMGDKVVLRIKNSPDSWIIEQAVSSAIQSSGCTVFVDSMSTQHGPGTDSL